MPFMRIHPGDRGLQRYVEAGAAGVGRQVTLLLVSIAIAICAAAQSNPIIIGNHPDPTIIRIGKTYWTASTSGGWAPEFPIYRSSDLYHWTAAGAVFRHTPEWATGDFWAPEMVSGPSGVLVYYVARQRGGLLCVAVATAQQPEGPYSDHGPIICQPDGSIDPAFARDEHGQPYLIWKEDGNSQGKPTPIWAQPLAADLIRLTGEKTQLLVNEPQSWEGGVVEAPYILRHDHHFFLFYAGNACCGTDCNYAEGVARADHLLGPWTKDPDNPIIRPNGAWKCPGHGTAVQTPRGEDYFLYHAYPVKGMASLGRESVLDRITWNAAGWPEVNAGHGPSGGRDTVAVAPFHDRFDGTQLDPEWKWPLGHEPVVKLSRGVLSLAAPTSGGEAFIARSALSPHYAASVRLLAKSSGGLALIADRSHQCALVRSGNRLELSRSDQDQTKSLWRLEEVASDRLSLKVQVAANNEASFSYSLDGTHWSSAGPPVSVAELATWDGDVRVGLEVRGTPAEPATFADFSLTPGKD